MKQIVRRNIECELTPLAHLPEWLQRIYWGRDIRAAEELTRELSGLLPYDSLLGIGAAVSFLADAIKAQKRILILGDFDADGATSTALAVSALHAFGARYVFYLVPNRFAYGYGLTPEIVEVANQHSPDIIITVDNGISSHAGVARAKELGIEVVITDHHLAGALLPNALAIVNPNQPGDLFPSKNLAGVGVIFYVMLALRAELKKRQWFEQSNLTCPNMAEYLDLVALGTVADVVPLDKNNRILVHQGLQRIRAGFMRQGVKALLEVAGRDCAKLKAQDLGFAIGPRLNAAGRLDDMSLGISCLLAEKYSVALTIAKQLDDLNKKRRVIENHMQQEAFSEIEKLYTSEKLPAGLCLYQDDWHQGVVGLVASRVKEKCHRPVIAFAREDAQNLKGSARSIPGLHIRDVLEAVATKHPDLITKFGGHAMAAGMSLPLQHFDAFSQAFASEVLLRVNEEDLQGRILSDGELSAANLCLEIAECIQAAGPWGQSFPEPLFDGEFNLISQRIVGERHLKLILQLEGSEHYLDAIAFNVDLDKWPNHSCQRVIVAYRLDINDFNNHKKLQLLIEHIQPLA